jgi:hypothetical protein
MRRSRSTRTSARVLRLLEEIPRGSPGKVVDCPRVRVSAWLRGCVAAWMRRCVDAWMRGCVDASMRGCVDAWMRRCVSACPRVRVSACPRGCVSACPRVRLSAWMRVRVSACPRGCVSACPRVRVSACPRVRVDACPQRWFAMVRNPCASVQTLVRDQCAGRSPGLELIARSRRVQRRAEGTMRKEIGAQISAMVQRRADGMAR